MTAQPIELAHGSYKGYQQHKKHGEEPCDECKQANAEYHASWRAANPNKHAQHQQTQAARARALRQLAKLHPLDMLDLYQQELRKLRNQGTTNT